MTLLMLLLVAADPPCRFGHDGSRLEDVRQAQTLTPEQEAGYRTIAEWGKMATTARSKQRRTDGARAAMHICLLKHKTPLSDAELAAAYEVVIKLLPERPAGNITAQEVEVRREAAATLGRLGFASAAVALRECATKDSESFVRSNCYRSLGLLKDEAAVPLLAKAVANEKPTPAIVAAEALGAIGTAEARAALEELTKQKLEENALEAVNRALDDLDLRK